MHIDVLCWKYWFIIIILLLSSCKKEEDNNAVKLASDNLYTFTVEFVSFWNEDIFPNDYPDSAAASWGNFTGLTHSNNSNILLQVNSNAGSGLATYAQTGDNTSLVSEITNLTNNSYNVINAVGGNASLVSYKFEFQTTSSSPYLTFVSKITPSPDWVIAIINLDLNVLALGGFIRYYITAYDIGKNSGSTYTPAGSTTNEVISIKEDYPLVNANGQYEQIGYVKISFKSKKTI